MKIKTPLVSVVIPTYNRGYCIERTINSVLAQTYKNFEIIIVDDGSTDNTKEVVEKYLKTDERIKYFYQENKGVCPARDTAMKLASGDYIVPLDSDNELLPDFFEDAVKRFENLPDNVSSIYYTIIDSQTKKVVEYLPFREAIVGYEDLLCCSIYECEFSIIERRNVIDEGYLYSEDVHYIREGIRHLRLAKKYKKCIVNKPVEIYHTEGEDRICKTRNPMLIKMGHIATLREFELFGEDLRNYCPEKYGSKLCVVALIYGLQGNRKKAIESFREAFKYCRNGYYLILYILTLLFGSFGLRLLYNLREFIKNL